MSESTRKLAAIMFTDMVGYTLLGQKNESLSLALVDEQRRVVRPILARHQGREIKTIGDAFLVEFPNAIDAMRCAYDIQRATRELNLSLAVDKRIHLRIGIHVGEVVESGGDISGDAVNVASRIEPLAEDGGVCLTRQAYDHVRGKTDLSLVNVGTRFLKNVVEPMEIYKIIMPWLEEASRPATHLDRYRVAVLPFANMSPDPNDEYFADGMTEELIDRLAQIKRLKIIARTSIMAYKKKEKKAAEIAKELDAGTLVEGSVRKAGNKIRVTVQLIRADTEEHLWSSHYDGSLEDIFAVQGEIAEKVAGELKVQLIGSEKATLEKRPTENTEAYTFFLKGRDLAREESEHSLRQAVELFQRAIALDPSFARAYEDMAECYMTLSNDGYEPLDVVGPKAELAARKALDLDPDLAEAYATLAYVHFNGDRLKQCELEAKRALELNPSISEAYRELAFIALVRGDGNGAISMLETALKLDPLRSFYIERLGQLYFFLGREDEALQFWERTDQLAPAATFRSKTEYHLFKGNYEHAKELFHQAEKLDPTHTWVSWMRGFIASLTADKEGALREISNIEKNYVSADALNGIAFISYGLGDFDSYFAYVNKAADQHALRIVYVMYSPLFSRARADPRYELLLDKVRMMNETP
jgi:adenylate cyclase